MNNYRHFFIKYNKPAIISEVETGRIIEINEKVLPFFGKTAKDFINLKRTDIFPQKAIKELNKQLKINKNNASTSTFILNKEGVKVEVDIHSEIITEQDKVFLLDTISLKENRAVYPESSELGDAERLIKESEIKYKTLFESANDAIFILKNNSIVELNSKALKMFAGTKEELLGKTPHDLSPEFQPDGKSSVEKVNEKLHNILNGPQFFEWQHKKLNNSVFNAEVSLNSIKINNETFILAIIRDISKRKKNELELIESRRSLSNLLKNLPGVAYRRKNDKRWTMEFISEGCNKLTGYKNDLLVGNMELSYGNLVHKEDKERIWQEVQKALENKKPFALTYRIKAADQKIKWVWEQGNGIYSDSTGKLLFIEGLINDITEQEITKEALKHSEEKFRSLVEESLVGVYIIQDEKFSYINPRLAEIFGYNKDEIISGKNIFEFIHEPDKKIVKENIEQRLSGSIETIHYTFRGVKKDNTLIDVEVMGSKTLFDGKPAVIGTLLDVTEKNKTEKEIRKLSQAVEQSPASIVITDINGNIEYVNSKFSEVTGYSSKEVIGKTPRIFKYGDTPQVYYQNLWKTIKSGEEWRGEFLNRKKNGELFWEFASISPIKDKRGNIANFLAVKEDITERKHVEEELRRAKENAEEMNRIKSVFLANMSHELRTPMVAILGYSEILKNEIETPDLKDMAKEIYDSSNRFISTLNLILDLSRIESNKEVINLTELDVASIAKEEFDFFKHLASRKNLQMRLGLPKEPIITLLDERMLRQIINHLTGNAVKFTNKGMVSLTIQEEIGEYNKMFVIISISDTGIGIPKNNQSIIFDAFRQISEGLNKTFEGSGLGLTVSKKFIEMMQGTIDVESEFGKGSTFIIKFPIFRKFDIQPLYLDPTQMKFEFPEKDNESIPLLLLVEDDQSNAGVIKFFLSSKYLIDSVQNGEEAVIKAAAKKYASVLMDIDLGMGMSGLEATKKIKQIPGYENTPIIAVTALAMRGDKEKFLAEGCTHYIAKPFKKEDLLHIIKEAIEQSK